MFIDATEIFWGYGVCVIEYVVKPGFTSVRMIVSGMIGVRGVGCK